MFQIPNLNSVRTSCCLLASLSCILSARADQHDRKHHHGREHNHGVPLVMHASATAFTEPTFVGTHMLMDVFGEGSANVFGPFTFEAPHDFDLSNGTYLSDAYIHTTCGDMLHVVTFGHFINAVDSIGTWNIVGGTGRFEEARGSGSVTNLNFGADISFEGNLSVED